MRSIFIILLSIVCQHSNAQTRVVNYQTACHLAHAAIQYTSITTAPNGDIYSEWMDSERNLKVLGLKRYIVLPSWIVWVIRLYKERLHKAQIKFGCQK
jgi:hypothetical protein